MEFDGILFYDTDRNSVIRAGNPTNNYSNVNVYRLAEDSKFRLNGFGLANTNGICINSQPIDNQLFARRTRIPMPGGCGDEGCPLMMKVRVYYSDQNQPVGIRVIGGPDVRLPAQGILISSTGTAGESTRRVNVFQGYSETPTFFDAAVFSKKSLVK